MIDANNTTSNTSNVDADEKERKKKFSFLRAIGMDTGDKINPPSVNDAANTIISRKKNMESVLKEM